jgi:hypothetical protein
MSTTVETGIFITRPPEAIAAVILEPANAVLWTSDLERFEVVSGTAGEAGAHARLHYVQNGRPYVMDDFLLSVEPNRRYVSRVTGEALTAEVTTSLEASGDGTRVSVRWTGSGKHPVFRLTLPFMRGSIRRQADADLRKLKDLVEGRQPGSTDPSRGITPP